MKKFTWVLAIAAIVGLSAPELDARGKHHHKGRQHAQAKKADAGKANAAQKHIHGKHAGKNAVHPIAQSGGSKIAHHDNGKHTGKNRWAAKSKKAKMVPAKKQVNGRRTGKNAAHPIAQRASKVSR